MFKAVLDSNILVSALVVPVGKPAQVIKHAHEETFALCLSEDILQETNIALHRRHIQRRFHPTEERIEEFLAALRDFCQLVTVQHVENIILNDPPDNLVLACAVEGKADYLVSGNLHLLDLEQHRGVKIVTPAQFLEILTSTRS